MGPLIEPVKRPRLRIYPGRIAALVAVSTGIEVAAGNDAGLKFFIGAILLPVYNYLVSWSSSLTARGSYRSVAMASMLILFTAGLTTLILALEAWRLGSELSGDSATVLPITLGLLVGKLVSHGDGGESGYGSRSRIDAAFERKQWQAPPTHTRGMF